MDISNGSHQLVRVKLHQERRDHLLDFQVTLHHFVQSVRNEIHDYIEVGLIRLLSVGVEVLSHLNAVRMMKHFQNLQLSVLIAFVLEDLLDGN